MNYRTANGIANNGDSSRRNNAEGMEAIGSVIERVLIGLAEKAKLAADSFDDYDDYDEDYDEDYDDYEAAGCDHCEVRSCDECHYGCCVGNDFEADEYHSRYKEILKEYANEKKRRKIKRAMLIAAGVVASAAALCAGASALAKRYESGKTVSADKRTFPFFNRGDGNG